MPIRYAEITIVRNLKEERWISYFKNLIGDEDIISNKDTIIIVFDDGSISDTNSKYENEQFKMGPKSYYYYYPIYFEKEDKNMIFFLKELNIENGVAKLDFRPIFKDYQKYDNLNKQPSIYNAIYEITGIGHVFALVKFSQNLKYLLAYDDSYFDKSDIGYFINCIFTNTFTYTNK
jgi:hypothetical protein